MDQKFQWKPCPEAQRVVDRLCVEFMRRSPMAQRLEAEMRKLCGTRFFDWIDHLVVPDDALGALADVGFEPHAHGGLVHRGAIFPRICGARDSGAPWTAALKIDSCADFAAVHGISTAIEGAPMGPLRRLCVERSTAAELWVIERHGCPDLEPPNVAAQKCVESQRVLEEFRARRRDFDDLAAACPTLMDLVDAAVDRIGQAWAADCFFAAERDYWMRRNRAARVQKARQDKLGLGWGNHDHHTYRSRREGFAGLVSVLEKLGCACRERFHAGAEAGWGAQVMESAEAGIVIFADVDMSAEEVLGDFAHEGLQAREELGTVGLWCALHGDSLFAAGMHHLECQFDFDALASGLQEEAGITVMPPFSNLPHLRQQFTEGERWPVPPQRINSLLERGLITREQAAGFRGRGAIGSHLENLERRDGYKGFNQAGINQIIAATDPRKLAV